MKSDRNRPVNPATSALPPRRGLGMPPAGPGERPHLYLAYSRDEEEEAMTAPMPVPVSSSDRRASLMAFATLLVAVAGLAAVLLTL